jgi:hypothetical protein
LECERLGVKAMHKHGGLKIKAHWWGSTLKTNQNWDLGVWKTNDVLYKPHQ